MRKRRPLSMLVALLLIVALIPINPVASAPATRGDALRAEESADPLDSLRAQTDGIVRVGYHAGTGKVNFIGTDPDRPLRQAAPLAGEATPESGARQFLAAYGSVFGLRDQAHELTVLRVRAADGGRSFVRFQQVYQGVPVFAGELIVQLDEANDVVSANGEILPDIAIAVQPAIDAAAARDTALQSVAGWHGVAPAALQATAPELWVYNPVLLPPGNGPTRLVWRTEVTAVDLLPIRELVLVDAQRGSVALHFNQIHTALNRTIYDNNNNPALGLPGNGPVRTEGGPASSIADVNAAYDYSGDTYNFYLNNHGRDSLNNGGMTLISTTRYCESGSPCPFPNAFWNGTQMVYGQGYASADDVVAHELTHGVTQYESNLFYYYQSGAINESFSDVWGEFVDLSNTGGNDNPGVRWQMGEDIPGGAIRNMQDPTLPPFNDPDKMTSPNYYSDSGEFGPIDPGHDNGGVHTNSGVNNKAVFLMTDGGTFNGQTVTSLGITKTVKIYYEAQTNLLTSGADYADLYNALYQACNNLIPAVTTAADCQEVQDATNAVEMNLQPVANYNTDAPLCPGGQTAGRNLFSDNLGSGAGNPTLSAAPWSLDSPDFGSYAHSGLHSLYGDDIFANSSSSAAMNASVTLQANAYLHFAHAYGFEEGNFDGGVLEYSTNSGASWNDAGSLLDVNGYDGTIASGSGNPLGGRSGFLADSHGYISSRANLSSLAGQSVRFRWRLGTDSSGYDVGWWVDDVRIYACSGGLPTTWFFDDLESGAGNWTFGSYLYLPIIRNEPAPPPPTSWTTIVQEDFEGAFPGPWQVFDDIPGAGEFYWSKRNCQAFAGNYSGWAVGGGANGSSLGCGANYPNDAESWMVYGPFSLVGATAADLSYQAWVNSEVDYDFLCRLASINGTIFDGFCTHGSTGGWSPRTLDLNNIDGMGLSYLGQPNVWIAIVFSSDFSFTFSEGAHVDNIVLRKCTFPSCPALLDAATASMSGGQITEVPAARTLHRPEESDRR